MILSEGHPNPITFGQLAKSLRKEDQVECFAFGLTPERALSDALANLGDRRSFLALSHQRGPEPVPVGAFGWTPEGFIWSLWAPLRISEAIEMLELTPLYVRKVLTRSKHKTLRNYIHADNSSALKWMENSECFVIDRDTTIMQGGLPFYQFTTKSAWELPH